MRLCPCDPGIVTGPELASGPKRNFITSNLGMPKPRLLFLAHLLPYPPDSGAAIRTYHVLRLLAQQFDVTALCFFRRESSSSSLSIQQRLKVLSALAHVEAFPIPQ